MEMIAGLPYASVEFGKDGSALPTNDLKRINNDLQSQGVTDLFVISHGWNNDKAEAHNLYERFFSAVKNAIDSSEAFRKRRYGVIGVFWPSKKFADEKQIPGGAAGTSSDRLTATSSSVGETLANLEGAFSAHDADAHLKAINALLSKVGHDQQAQRAVMDHIREIMRSASTDATAANQNEDNVGHFLTLDAGELLHMLGSPPRSDGARAHTAGVGGAADARPHGSGAAAGISFSGAWDAIKNGLNYATYYEMKNRAGIVGRKGLYSTLRELRQANPDRKMHLIGHSFGARVVTAATDGPVGQGSPIRPESLTLAQAAFSHYGFAIRWDGAHDGLFRSVITSSKLAGPLLVTHSVNDKAVGIAYAIASRIANQVASAIGDEHDIYGGLGRNGALKCGALNATLGNQASYKWTPAAATNLNADKVIRDHSDIAKRELGDAILAAVLTT